MKVLGISGGTRNGSNDMICKEALMGAKEAGAEVEFINLFDLELKDCTGCIACVKSLMSGRGGGCVLKDDFDWLQGKMMDADAVLLVTPIFESGSTGTWHTVADRFGPRADRAMNIVGTKIAEETGGTAPDPRKLKDKVCSIISIGGSDWMTRTQCDMAMIPMTMAWKVIDNEVFPWSKSIVMEDDKVARAHEIGVNLAESAKDIENAHWMGEPGVCPHCHSNEFYLDNKLKKAICTLCGLEGRLLFENEEFRFDFPPETEPLAHDTITGKFKHADDIRENEGRLADFKKSDRFKERAQKYREFIQPTKPVRE